VVRDANCIFNFRTISSVINPEGAALDLHQWQATENSYTFVMINIEEELNSERHIADLKLRIARLTCCHQPSLSTCCKRRSTSGKNARRRWRSSTKQSAGAWSLAPLLFMFEHSEHPALQFSYIQVAACLTERQHYCRQPLASGHTLCVFAEIKTFHLMPTRIKYGLKQLDLFGLEAAAADDLANFH
jgi:hypothetical protein